MKAISDIRSLPRKMFEQCTFCLHIRIIGSPLATEYTGVYDSKQ